SARRAGGRRRPASGSWRPWRSRSRLFHSSSGGPRPLGAAQTQGPGTFCPDRGQPPTVVGRGRLVETAPSPRPRAPVRTPARRGQASAGIDAVAAVEQGLPHLGRVLVPPGLEGQRDGHLVDLQVGVPAVVL